MVHEARSQAHPQSSCDEEITVTRKQKAEGKPLSEPEQSPKKAKTEENKDVKAEDGKNQDNGKSNNDVREEFIKFCKETSERLSIQQMREILQANGQDASGEDDTVVPRCQDIMFYGPLDNCPICGGKLEVSSINYSCKGAYSEWSTCTYATKDPPRKDEPLRLPDTIQDSAVANLLRKHQDPKGRYKSVLTTDKPKVFRGMMISLAGRLSKTHQYWKTKIEKNGGKVSNSVIGASCLVVSPAERDRGSSTKLADAMEQGIPVVREGWLNDCIEKQETLPLEAYDVVSDLSVAGRGIPLNRQDTSEEALETLTAELKVFGKRGVHKDSKLQDEGGQILEKDGVLYNCAFAVCDKGREVNDFCVVQLISVPEKHGLYMYYKKGKIGDVTGAEERLEEWVDINNATKEFAKQFQGLTGSEFEPWEREKKIEKKPQKFFPIDMDDGVEVRHGGLGLRQLEIAAAHCKLEPKVANFMKVLCSQEIYRYALTEMGLDNLDMPIGMLSDFHFKRCEGVLHEFVDKLTTNKETGQKAQAIWSDFSQRWFTLMPSTRPYIFRDFSDFADNAASAFETARDITVASHLVGDMTGSTLNDPLFDRYTKLGCSITPMENDTDDYKMISNYLETTYEPVKVGEISYGVSIDNVFAVEVSACPSLDEMKKFPNKMLLWCGSRSSNMLRHLRKGFLPAVCYLPVPGYMFGKAIVCSDAAAEAARYGFTAVDRPEGFLVLAVASMGEKVTELTNPPEDASSLEEKKLGVKGLGRKKTDESEHFIWKDDIKVPCGKIIPSEHKDSILEYNEYAIYDPKQVSIRFLVSIKFEEKGVEYDVED